ncbi:hypothetical protein E6R60_26265 [Streptomyces sp. A0642]|uniref:hypothetical protein n=1 Tax=Streptomyces sp. A0642 TaxID=2563100 RepID=UPI0010A27076|nr:hypothetical protein [Streptomyces sp. A0642]THA72441.1 hypothetical protein E6R60_26265 [Streptomyces sp. A0642]
MPDTLDFSKTLRPVGDPTCCPDAYLCVTEARAEIECPRHGGFTVCCSAQNHIGQNRDAWHREMDRWEQELLNKHILRFKILKAFELESSPFAETLRTNI